MKNKQQDQLIDYLGQFISEHKKTRIEEVINNRTKYVTVALEDIFKPHNANAVIRSCEGFGVQDLHVIENKYDFGHAANVTQGAQKWVNVIRYCKPGVNNTASCYARLRKDGYKILAAMPDKKALRIGDINVNEKLAIVFGSELDGLGRYASEHADDTVYIPMSGFSQSLNLSVSVAICLYELVNKLRRSRKIPWKLTHNEKQRLKLDWFRKTVRASALLEKNFMGANERLNEDR